MSRFSYQQHHLDFLRREYPKRSMESLTKAFNQEFGTEKTVRQIHTCTKNHKIRCGRKKGEITAGAVRLLNAAQDKFVRKQYQHLTRPELTAALNERFGTEFTVRQITAYVKNRKIKSGRTGHFKPGNVPAPNARPKGPNRTSFKKGDTPPNLKPLGSERMGKDGYIWIKVAEPDPYTGRSTRYKQKHIHLWEQAHGEIPENMIVRFKDGDRENIQLSNLEIISRAEHAILNKRQYHDQPEELKPSVRLLAKLQAKTAERSQNTANQD